MDILDKAFETLETALGSAERLLVAKMTSETQATNPQNVSTAPAAGYVANSGTQGNAAAMYMLGGGVALMAMLMGAKAFKLI